MARSNGLCFVYVRFWPGFTDTFPYQQFNQLTEKTADRAVWKALVGELWRRYEELLDKLHERERRRVEDVVRRRSQFLGRPTGARRHYSQRPTVKLRRNRLRRFIRCAHLVDWHNFDGPVTTELGDVLFSSRFWVAFTESSTIAQDLVSELTELVPVTSQEREHRRVFNPRFGFVSAAELSNRDKASALSAIARLRSAEPMRNMADLARALLPRVDEFVAAWRVIAQSTEPDASDRGEQLTGDGDSGAQGARQKQSTESGGAPAGAHAMATQEGRDAQFAKLDPCEQKAYFSFQMAEVNAGHRLPDREAFDWLKENGLSEDAGDLGGLAGYELPSFETWVRQLRTSRNALGEQKYSRRAGRATGRSVARRDEI